MNVTHYAEINTLLETLLKEQQKILGDKFVGLYLYGSLIWGDFYYALSDIDLLAALQSDLTDEEAKALKKKHEELAQKFKDWDDRIEVQYLSLHGLRTFKTQRSPMGNISPGEPFHVITVGKEWLLNWYFVQDYGKILYGPDPRGFIDKVTKEEFIQAVKDHALDWKKYIQNIGKHRGAQAYAILTLCRAYYTIKNGKQVSKKEAATWMQEKFPKWKLLIQNALKWRDEQIINKTEDLSGYPQTVAFVTAVIDLIEKESASS
ncbi:MAG: aminoglycoside adenylyltransferase domain-containing protein [Patescibacteria group bacterium]